MAENPALGFEPERHLIGEVAIGELELRDGWNHIAEHASSGVHLWAGAVDGNTLCYRFVAAGAVLPTLSIYKPDPEGLPPLKGPTGPPPGGCPGGPIASGDGGTDGGGQGKECLYVCTATGDGGYQCFKVCS